MKSLLVPFLYKFGAIFINSGLSKHTLIIEILNEVFAPGKHHFKLLFPEFLKVAIDFSLPWLVDLRTGLCDGQIDVVLNI